MPSDVSCAFDLDQIRAAREVTFSAITYAIILGRVEIRRQRARNGRTQVQDRRVGLFHPRPSRRIDAPLNRPYRVTQRLPEADGQPQYQIRFTLTGKEFAASDGELRAIA